ncbi:MAG: LysM peptidoglycan-binding domain-containing protein [Chloroflexi bacterium]|nr:LysM peptidoglycan-binding domain-containing protein [Chloroflexota bacterium]
MRRYRVRRSAFQRKLGGLRAYSALPSSHKALGALRRTRRVGLIVLAGMLSLGAALGWLGGALPEAVQAAPLAAEACPSQDVSTLIALANQVRTSAGQAPFETHPILMQVAQAHSQYQAEIGQGTHIGPGGSRPADRVKAAGYGQGASYVYVSENIAWGYQMTPQRAIEIWVPSAPHYHTLTAPQYIHVGAGCARRADGRVYYTLVAAGVAGQGPPPEFLPTATATPPPLPSPTPTLPYEPVIPATPRADGAVIHTVRRGQTLLMIALSYRVPLEDLLRYNGLTEHSLLQVGQQLIIVPPQTPASPTPSAPPPSPTPFARVGTPLAARVTRTPSPRAEASLTQTPTARSTDSTSADASPPGWVLAAAASGLLLAAAGYGLSLRHRG